MGNEDHEGQGDDPWWRRDLDQREQLQREEPDDGGKDEQDVELHATATSQDAD